VLPNDGATTGQKPIPERDDGGSWDERTSMLWYALVLVAATLVIAAAAAFDIWRRKRFRGARLRHR
jgi:hypothetical protein